MGNKDLMEIIEHRNKGLTYEKIAFILGTSASGLRPRMCKHGYAGRRDNLKTQLINFGYNKDESAHVYKLFKKNPSLNFLDYLQCRCNDDLICLPHQLNNLTHKTLAPVAPTKRHIPPLMAE